MQIISRSLCVAIALAMIGASTVDAQTEAKRLIQQAFKQTKSARTADDYTAVIDSCQQAQAFELSEANGKYVKQLEAWALNRRGEAFVEQAATLLDAGDAEQAAKLDGKALADFKASVERDATKWKAVHNRGVSFALVGKYETALEDFSRVVELKPDYENAWFNRAEIRYELGNYQAAVADYTQAIELAPSDFGATIGRGHALYQLGEFGQAVTAYTAAIQLAPDNADAHANRGDAHRELQQWEAAASDFRTAIELEPSAQRGYQAAAWLMSTCPDERFRNPKLGLQAATKAAELAGDPDYQVLDTLAAAHANAGNFQDAVASIAQALKIAPASDANALARRLELYNAATPYREAPVRTARAEGEPTR